METDFYSNTLGDSSQQMNAIGSSVNYWPYTPKDNLCPNCARCACCGRPFEKYNRYPYNQPVWMSGSGIVGSSSSQDLCSSTAVGTTNTVPSTYAFTSAMEELINASQKG